MRRISEAGKTQIVKQAVFPKTHSMFNDLKLSLWHSRAYYFPDLTQTPLPFSVVYFSRILFPWNSVLISQLGKLSFANRGKKSIGSNNISLLAIISIFSILYITINFSQTLGPLWGILKVCFKTFKKYIQLYLINMAIAFQISVIVMKIQGSTWTSFGSHQ